MQKAKQLILGEKEHINLPQKMADTFKFFDMRKNDYKIS